MTNDISVITPNIETGDTFINLNISDKNAMVQCYEDNIYTIIHKNGNYPDTEITDDELNLLIKAKTAHHYTRLIINYFINNDSYDNSIIDDKKLILSILDAVLSILGATGICSLLDNIDPIIENHALSSLGIKKYKKSKVE